MTALRVDRREERRGTAAGAACEAAGTIPRGGPFGWSLGRRIAWALGASALLWLAVLWALS